MKYRLTTAGRKMALDIYACYKGGMSLADICHRFDLPDPDYVRAIISLATDEGLFEDK